MKLTVIARLGYLARAIVYFLMGCFTILLIIGSPLGAATDSKGALRQLMEQPLGHVLLFILACGLFSYSLWRFAQSFMDVSHVGSDRKAIIKRFGYAIGGFTHALLGIYAIKLIFSLSANSAGSERSLAQWLLSQPFGQLITGAFALIIIGFGITQFIIGWKSKYMEQLNLPNELRSWLSPICKFGFIARGFVFLLIGSFFFQAAFHFNSQKAGGISMAWKVLRQQPFGQFLIALVAIGFIAFSIYGFAESKYQKQISA